MMVKLLHNLMSWQKIAILSVAGLLLVGPPRYLYPGSMDLNLLYAAADGRGPGYITDRPGCGFHELQHERI